MINDGDPSDLPADDQTDSVTDGEGNGATPSDNAPIVSIELAESDAPMLNPERGYYVGYDILNPARAAQVRSQGYTLAISVVHLDAYRTSDIDAAFLASLDRGFDAARAAGIKIVLRFSYVSYEGPDSSRTQILRHIEQVRPLLQEHADVIAVMQAGFIGAWGEWHSSTNGLNNDADHNLILGAVLDALPVSRNVQVRRPRYKDRAFPGGPLEADEAYSGSDRARVGHHNDCFLSSPSDYGTYDSPVDQGMSYVSDDGRFTAIGGETCNVYAPRSDCSNALPEMESLHFSYLNKQYNVNVLNTWVTQGCAAEVDRRLGYRLAATRVAHTSMVAPGGELDLQIEVMNRGFAALYNERPIEIVLSDGATRRVVRLADVDARQFAAGVKSTLTVRLRIPADMGEGSYKVAMRLPDAAATLAGDTRYAIRLANDEGWSAETGDNVLVADLSVDPDAPGPRDPGANELVELR